MALLLIRKLGTRLSKFGNSYSSYGEFLCPFDNKIVIRTLSQGKSVKSCGCKKNQFISESHKGIQYSEKTKQKVSIATKGKNNPMYGVHRFGELAPNWQEGKSFEEYPQEFNEKLKKFIKNRDMCICQNSNCMNTEKLHIHHIDFNKQNNNPKNLITLCRSCHAKTYSKNKRNYFINYYKEIVSIYL